MRAVMTEPYTEEQAAAKLGLPYRKLRNVLNYNPSAPRPPKVGRDRLWWDHDIALADQWLDEYERTPVYKYRCAQCGLYTANNRKLHMVGDCREHGRQVPVVRSAEPRKFRRHAEAS